MDIGLRIKNVLLLAIALAALMPAGHAVAADTIKGQVLGGNAPIGRATVTLWEASVDAPRQISQTKTGEDGKFQLSTAGVRGSSIPYKEQRGAASTPSWMHTDAILYLVAAGSESKAGKTGGDNPAIVLITVLGENIPRNVVINRHMFTRGHWFFCLTSA